MFPFENFSVYLKSEDVYKKLLDILNNKTINPKLKDQLRRAALSINLNIAEGAGKFSKNDKKNFYLIARGSTNECVAILRLLKIEDKISDSFYKELYEDFSNIGKMLSGLINSMLAQNN